MIRNGICKLYRTEPRYFHTSTSLCGLFWEKDDKGGYKQEVKHPFKERMRIGLQELKKEVALWRDEWKERFEMDPTVVFRPDEVDVAWQFSKPDSLEKWIVTNDSDHNEGYSHSSLTLTARGTGLFSGHVSLKTPKDGRVKRAGYCNIRTLTARKSFKRRQPLNWVSYNTLVLKVRGDGRSYMLNISTRGYYDITWNDMYHYVLFTRGGPYWQIAKIPFSKFFLSSKGRIQDKQCPIPLDKVNYFGITAADRYGGDFALEIDYVGLEYDPHHENESFAYEMYNVPGYMVQT